MRHVVLRLRYQNRRRATHLPVCPARLSSKTSRPRNVCVHVWDIDRDMFVSSIKEGWEWKVNAKVDPEPIRAA